MLRTTSRCVARAGPSRCSSLKGGDFHGSDMEPGSLSLAHACYYRSIAGNGPAPQLRALEQLKARAEATKSDAVVIVKDGKLVADWSFGHPRIKIEAMSATKSIVSLGIGRVVDMGKIKIVEQPVWDYSISAVEFRPATAGSAAARCGPRR